MYSSAKKLQRVLSSGEIRKTFVDYFISNHGHKFVRSSPVVPFSDPTVAFVNAGMNQFKSVFLGTTQPPYARVANSQKCVRVGGKHNDLSIVGQDSYHHTFFEMLGNWSFGDYFKREACAFALELLRGPYGIDPSRLYVTYFAGDPVLGLPADLECFEIWRSLGFPAERILPFGSKDNFWEMGTTGPCGPCTEIHIDHLPERAHTNEGAKLVNAGRPDLTELWNLVFIQYNRNDDGTVTQLPTHNVDTGMGFERLTAILQNKTSNYDTDLFTPLFDCIQKVSKAPLYSGRFPTQCRESAPLDTGYRILADHARMVTACLSDGMLPDQNQKLRRVLRKAFTVSESVFANETLLGQLVPVVVDTLGSAYPEMCAKQTDVLELIAHEQEIFKALRESSAKAFTEVLGDFPNLEDIDLMESPGFVPAYREFRTQRSRFANNTIPGEFLYKLADTYGLTEDAFLKLAELEQMHCDLSGYKREATAAKLKTKASFSSNCAAVEQRALDALSGLTRVLPATDNCSKYNYSYDDATKQYKIPRQCARVTGLLLNDSVTSSIAGHAVRPGEDTICVVTDVSNFYYESGGQQSDCGKLRLAAAGSELELDVVNVIFVNDCVAHVCRRPSDAASDFLLQTGDVVELIVDSAHRKLNTCHHTATHLLNAAVRHLFQKVTYQVSSAVSSEQCKLELGIIGRRLTKEDVQSIEDLIGRLICSAMPTEVQVVNAADVLQRNDVTMVPGEIYPETGLRLVSISGGGGGGGNLLSRELCCGTHVTNTRELEYFCITHMKQTNRARYAFTAVAATAAENVLKAAALIRHRVDLLAEQCLADRHTNATDLELQKLRNSMLHGSITLPYAFKVDTLERINELLRKLRETSRLSLKEFVEVEMKNLLQEKPLATHPFIVHYISSSALMEEVPLQRATRTCTDRPILVISMCDNVVKARCCVPEGCTNAQFTAEKWLLEFAAVFRAQVAAPKSQDAAIVCNMKGRKVSTQFEEQLEDAIRRANEFAAKHFKICC